MTASIDSVSASAARALAPRRLTKYASTTTNSDSPSISSTIGMASSRTPRFRLPDVKSCSVPRIASRTERQRLLAVKEWLGRVGDRGVSASRWR